MEGRQVSKSGAVSRWSLTAASAPGKSRVTNSEHCGPFPTVMDSSLWTMIDGKPGQLRRKWLKQHVADMFSDSMGLIWVSTYEGDIITMDKGNVVGYPVKSDSPLRFVMAFAEHAPQEIWAGGAGGLALIDRGHFRPIRSAALDFWM